MTTPLRHVSRNDFLLAAAIAWLATLLWTLVAGKDVGWDVFNHHLYIPFAWSTGRIDADFYGAGSQAYQNPLGYLPFYWLVESGLPAWGIGAALATLHAANALIAFRIAATLWKDQPDARLWCGIAAALAGVTPVFLQTAGTSSMDPLTAALVLGAMACLLAGDGAARTWRPMLAGLLLGLAFAAKQSNAVFVLSCGSLALWQAWRSRIARPALACMGGGILGIALGMGAWSWHLWTRFGNPIFPFYNNVFRSPYATTEPVAAVRFLPEDVWDWLARLWEMAEFRRYIYLEAFAPDLRPLVLLSVLAAGACVLAWRAARHQPQPRVGLGTARQADADLALLCVASYLLWMATSGNGRYAIPLLMLLGIALARAAYLLLPRAVARVGMALLLVLQLGYFAASPDLRAGAEPWSAGPYMDYRVPARLRDQPYLHLTVLGAQTNASLAPYLHPEGALVVVVGQFSLPMSGPIGEQLQSRLRKWQGRTRILAPSYDLASPGAPRLKLAFRSLLQRLHLDIDWSDCEQIRYEPAHAPDDSWYWLLHAKLPPGVGERPMMSCAAVPAAGPDEAMERERELVDRVFHWLERSCPQVYGPAPLVSEHGLTQWERVYANTDTLVSVSLEKGVFASRERVIGMRFIGTVDDVLEGHANAQCRPWPLVTPQ
jgi:hypothetical protein